MVDFSLSIEGCLTLTPPLGWSPANIRINLTSSETREIVLPEADNRTIVSSFIWTQYRSVTEEQTDRRTYGRIALDNTALCIARFASNADALLNGIVL